MLSETFAKIPKEFLQIKSTIDQKSVTNDPAILKTEFKAKFADEMDEYQFETLLFYLQFTGSILFFHDNSMLNQFIFPDPPKLSKWIYEDVLSKEFKQLNNGILNFENLVKKLGENNAWLLREILFGFNLIFEEKEDSNNLVIPQFLPERNDSFKTYLLELIPYSFSLRFEDFIHEGRIFQFISEYGLYSSDNHSFWKYGILFTKESIKTLVFYNKDERVINVHLENKKGYFSLAKEIFLFFAKKEEKTSYSGKRLSAYAREKKVKISQIFDFLQEKGHPIMNNPNARIPLEIQKELDLAVESFDYSREKTGIDLFPKVDNLTEHYSRMFLQGVFSEKITTDLIIEGTQLSTNGKNYIDVKDVLNSNTKKLNIGVCVDSKQKIELDFLAINILDMDNRKLPKVFISYSGDDYKYKEELKTHLALLERYQLLEFWDCNQIKAGKWHEQIQTKLEEADILVFMVSANFMNSNYIMESEVQKGIEMAEKDQNKKIICVLVGECIWNRWDYIENKYEKLLSTNPEKPFGDMNLSQFQFLPYHEYKDQYGNSIKQEILSLEQWGRHPNDVIKVAYKQIVSKILNEI